MKINLLLLLFLFSCKPQKLYSFFCDKPYTFTDSFTGRTIEKKAFHSCILEKENTYEYQVRKCDEQWQIWINKANCVKLDEEYIK